LAHPFGQTVTGLFVRPEVLNFSSQRGVVLVKQGPVDAPCQFEVRVKEQFVAWRQWGGTRRLGNGVKGTRMDSTVTSICGEEFWERGAQVIADEWGNDILIT